MKVSELPGRNQRELSLALDLVQGEGVTVIVHKLSGDVPYDIEVDTPTYKAQLFMQGDVP